MARRAVRGAAAPVPALGVSACNEEYAKHLRLNHANRDANALASAFAGTPRRASTPGCCPGAARWGTSKDGILRALDAMGRGMHIRPLAAP